MIKQIMLLKWADTANERQRGLCLSQLRALPRAIGELRSLEIFEDLGIQVGNSDVVVVSTFDDSEAWRAYQAHPEHKRVVTEVVAPILAEKSSVLIA